MKSTTPTSSFQGPSTGRASSVGSRRIVKTLPRDIPLKPEQRYVQPEVAHVSVFTGLFSWAFSQKKGKQGGRVKLNRQSYAPDGIQAPTSASRTQAKFNNYFALGTEKDLRPKEKSSHLNVHRNRLLFLVFVAAVIIYSLVWITR
ncbi:hypothetical protein P3T73_12685 [Kiritimatiellota bacterium B12222]|nr:hypothetical protein P3T73_12685 [Kiritimatiellota bacterium B12222]